MARLRFRIAISLDGYTAGPNQSVTEPLGTGGEELHTWVFPLAAWGKPHGLTGGTVNQSTPVIEDLLANIGATIMAGTCSAGIPAVGIRRSRGTGGGVTLLHAKPPA